MAERAATEEDLAEVLARARRLGEAGRFEEVIRACEGLLARTPDHGPALDVLGLALLQMGRREEAVRTLRRAVTVEPRLASAYGHLALALAATGDADGALEALHRAVDLAPSDATLWHNLGIALQRAARPKEAVPALEQSLALEPMNARAILSLGHAFHALGRTDEAVGRFFEAAAVDPRLAQPWNALGVIFRARGLAERACACFRRAVAIEANYPEALNNLAATLIDGGQPGEARQLLETALKHAPRLTDALLNSGDLAGRTGRLGESIDFYRRALESARGVEQETASLDALVFALRRLCRWPTDLAALTVHLMALIEEAAVPTLSRLSPFRSLSLPLPASAQRRIAEAHARGILQAVELPPRLPQPPRGPIHLGYLSADFRDHPVGHLIAGLFAKHDRASVRVTAYAYGPADDSPWRRRIATGADRLIDLAGLGDAAAAQQIRTDGIDLLIDLTGFTEHARPRILASRPAALNVSWLGFPGTTGAPYMDYVLADATVIPPGAEAEFSEAIVRLPLSYQVNDDGQPIGPTPTRGECGLPEGQTVFCCFNSPYKITPEVFESWMRIMSAVPQSVLWLFKAEPEVETNLRGEAVARGVDPRRLIFAERASKPMHLARQGLADLFLDTWPYNAHTTASDALRVGVPIVTLQGSTFAGRVAGSLLRALGASQLIATDLTAYEAIAINLARGQSQRERTRAAILAGSTALFDTSTFARHLEEAFQTMMRRWAAGDRASGFDVR